MSHKLVTIIFMLHIFYKVYKGTVVEKNGEKSAVAIKGEKKFTFTYFQHVLV